LPQFLGRLAPVEADPAGRVVARTIHELLELFCRAPQRKGLLDDQRLADGEARQSLQPLFHLAGFGIEVDAKEIEVLDDLLRDEAGGQALAVEAPVHETDGDEMPPVVLPDGGGQMPDPLPGDRRSFAVALVERDAL